VFHKIHVASNILLQRSMCRSASLKQCTMADVPTVSGEAGFGRQSSGRSAACRRCRSKTGNWEQTSPFPPAGWDCRSSWRDRWRSVAGKPCLRSSPGQRSKYTCLPSARHWRLPEPDIGRGRVGRWHCYNPHGIVTILARKRYCLRFVSACSFSCR